MSVYERLLKYQDLDYRDFQSRIVPNIDKKTIIGVRTPQMREIVKDIYVKRFYCNKDDEAGQLIHEDIVLSL